MSLLSRLAIDSSKLRGLFENRSISLFAFLACAFLFLPISHPLLAAPTATVTTLEITPNNVDIGTTVDFIATVTANGAAVTSGQVIFCYADTPYCEGSSLLAVAQVRTNGTAHHLVYFPPVEFPVYAFYQGTTTYAPSKSTLKTLRVVGGMPSTTTLVTSGTPGNYTLTATIVGPERRPITGRIEFYATVNNQSLAYVGPGPSTRSYTLAQQTPYSPPPSTVLRVANVDEDSFVDFISAFPKAGGGGTVSVRRTVNPYWAGNLIGLPIVWELDVPGPGRPYDVAVNDFNRDGYPDLAVVVSSSNPSDGTPGSVYLLLSDPMHYGTFPTRASFTVGLNANAIVVADFNHDGFPDLAVSNSYDGTYSILFGNPANPGSFLPQQVRTAGSQSTGMVTDDFNGDGLPDLAFSYGSSSANHLDVLLNNPATPGQFLPAVVRSLTAPARSLTSGDLNQDGLPDLAFAKGNGLALLLSDATHPGIFLPEADYTLPSSAVSVALGDYTGNGIFDVAVLINSGTTIGVLRQDENHPGALLPILTYSVGATAPIDQLFAADINFDGITDLAEFSTINHVAGSALVSYAQTAQETAVVSDIPGGYAHAVFNGDGFYMRSDSCSVPLTPPSNQTPTIANLKVTNVTANSATISWTTNIPTQGSVDYGNLGSTYLLEHVSWDRIPVTSHSFTLTALQSGSTYNYLARGVVFGQGCTHSSAISPTGSFITPAAP